MAEKKFQCRVITPEAAVLDTPASFAAIPAHDGEIGILRDRAPLLCRLGVGVLRLDTPEGRKHLYIDAGFAEVLNNDVTLLTEHALKPDQIDVTAEQAALQEARERRAITEEEHEARRRDMERARGKIKAAGQ